MTKELIFTLDGHRPGFVAFFYSDGTYRYSTWNPDNVYKWRIDENGALWFFAPNNGNWHEWDSSSPSSNSSAEILDAYRKYLNDQADKGLLDD